MSKISIGKMGEAKAVEFLKQNGYVILALNFRAGRFGEIDIIAGKKDLICFVEVKTRSSTFFGMPHESVNYRKQQKIKKTAMMYITGSALWSKNMRFDIIEVLVEKSNNDYKVKDVNMIENAF